MDLGEEVEGSIYIHVHLPLSRRMVGVWCLPTTTMKEIDKLCAASFPHPGVPFGEPKNPRILMHRFNISAALEWDVSVAEAGSKYYRYYS